MILLSFAVTRVSSPEIAVALAVTPVVGSLTVVSKAVISDALVVIAPSALVTLVVSPEIALALVTISPSAVLSSDCRVVTLLDRDDIELPWLIVVASKTLIALVFPDIFEFAVFKPDWRVVIADALLAILGSARLTH